ncbi:MAG TPA: S8 family serine peptidase [Solirubrobacteraceae bacterium]|nr:S8 family serine peptidase [Solirubrobacteraceae bacterium]
MRQGRPLLLLAFVLLALGVPATAGAVPAAQRPAADAPLLLPPQGARAARAAVPGWLVGAAPSTEARTIARRHGARQVAPGIHAVPTVGARTLAGALRAEGLLRFSEPDRPLRRLDAEDGFTNWRATVVPPGLREPTVRAGSPLVAVLDSPADLGHPDLAGVTQSRAAPPFDEHGTAVASMVSARRQGSGMAGVWPGARTLVVPTGGSQGITCSQAVSGLGTAVQAGVAVVNMSFGSPGTCFAMELAINRARTAGVVLVAAAGNEGEGGESVSFPASYPHVLSVASTDVMGNGSAFSTANEAVDVGAPGEGVTAALPGGGHGLVEGTSFSAPIVAGVAAWVAQRRPALDAGQIADVLRESADDIGPSGYDPFTGFGLVDLPGALAASTPRADPMEVNDDIEWVDGRRLGRARDHIWRGGRRAAVVRARADLTKDPVDVYRVRVPARRSARVAIAPQGSGADVDLEVFSRSARTVYSGRGLVGRSVRKAGRRDVVRFTNRVREARTFYVCVFVPTNAQELGAGYTLGVRRP